VVLGQFLPGGDERQHPRELVKLAESIQVEFSRHCGIHVNASSKSHRPRGCRKRGSTTLHITS